MAIVAYSSEILIWYRIGRKDSSFAPDGRPNEVRAQSRDHILPKKCFCLVNLFFSQFICCSFAHSSVSRWPIGLLLQHLFTLGSIIRFSTSQIVSQFERVRRSKKGRSKKGRSDSRPLTVQFAIVKWDHFIFHHVASSWLQVKYKWPRKILYRPGPSSVKNS